MTEKRRGRPPKARLQFTEDGLARYIVAKLQGHEDAEHPRFQETLKAHAAEAAQYWYEEMVFGMRIQIRASQTVNVGPLISHAVTETTTRVKVDLAGFES